MNKYSQKNKKLDQDVAGPEGTKESHQIIKPIESQQVKKANGVTIKKIPNKQMQIHHSERAFQTPGFIEYLFDSPSD